MHKILLAIGDEPVRFITATSLVVSYEKTDKCDIAVLITLKEDSEDEPKANTILDIPKSSGIEMESKFSENQPVSNVDNVQRALDDRRKEVGISILTELDEEVFKKTTIQDVPLLTPSFAWDKENSQVEAVNELVKMEKAFKRKENQVLFISEAPKFHFTKEGQKFFIRERVTICDKIVKIEEAKIVNKKEEPRPEPSSEVKELMEIFEDLFNRNPSLLRSLLLKDNNYTTAKIFFIGQATTITSGKIPDSVINETLNSICKEYKKAAETTSSEN